MNRKHNKALTQSAKELRKNMTPEERHLWFDFLRTYPLRFRRQMVIDDFIADFYCHEARLVIELDGSQHYTEEGISYDERRTKEIEAHELKVIRFSNEEVNRNFNAVCEEIEREVNERTMNPSVSGCAEASSP